MTILLTSDWHLTDNPNDEYRWAIFDHVARWIKLRTEKSSATPTVYMLGDITDRKDRHSAALVNRLTNCFCSLIDQGASIWVMMGNHDKPLNGAPFWSFLDHLRQGNDLQSGVTFVTEPRSDGKLILLPYSDNPAVDWAEIKFKELKAAFMHQTVTGVKGNNGFVLENTKMRKLPKALKVYSGDIHTTQIVSLAGANVCYIGAPHPVAFGDDYPPQMIELDHEYMISRVIKIPTIQKLMLRINSPKDLQKIEANPHDQARVICKLALSDLDHWQATQDAIAAWAAKKGVNLFSIEPEIEPITLAKEDKRDLSDIRESDPEHILRMFADAEEIDDRMFQAGITLLKEIA